MKEGTICLLLANLLALVLSTGNDFKVGRKPDDTVMPKFGEKPGSSSPDGEVNWCEKSDSRCPLNVCVQAGRVCCWCDSYCNWDPFGVIQPCFCCPKDHVCCSSSKPVWLKSPPTCCPSSTECSYDGRSCLQKMNSVPSAILTELCETTNYNPVLVNPKLPNKDRASVSNTVW